MTENEVFLETFLAKHFSGIVFPEAIKAKFLKKCKEQDIYMAGLSSFVKEPLIAAIALSSQDKEHDIDYKFDVIFTVMTQKLAEENRFLKWQFSKATKDNSIAHPQPTIAQRLETNKPIPDNYWLQTDDIINALEPLSLRSEIYIHSPVTKIDASVEACIKAALNTTAKIAYVTVASGGHWTLEIYQKSNNKITATHYNPRGDGKCGDDVVNKIYNHVQETFNENLDFGLPANASSVALREQTIKLNQKNVKKIENVAEKSIKSTEISKAINPGKINANTNNSILNFQTKTSSNEFDKLCQQWNALANHVLDELAHCSDEEKAKRWDKFVKDATVNIQTKSQNSTVFQQHQTATGITNYSNCRQEEQEKNSLPNNFTPELKI